MRLFLLFFFASLITFSQNFKGKVLDKETYKPIENVTIYSKKQQIGTTSNKNGKFSLTISLKEKDTIRFSVIGYTPKRITFSKLKQLNFIVHLSKKIEHLNEVIVTKKRDLKNQIPFTKLSSLKKGVSNFGSELINDKIYIIGGDISSIEKSEIKALQDVSLIPNASFADLLKEMKFNFSFIGYNEKLYTYDIKENIWSKSAIELKKRAYHRSIHINNKLYTFGGKTLSKNKRRIYLNNEIEVINLENEEILVDQTNPHQAVNFAAFPYLDNIIVMGGSTKLKENNEKVYRGDAHIYNTSSGHWYELPKMTKPKEVNGILVKNTIYLIGGFNQQPLTEIESYNLKNGKWEQEGNLFSGIENPALAYSNNVIYIFSKGVILTYNTNTKILNEYKIGLDTESSQMYCYKGKLYILGGYIENRNTKSSSSKMNVVDLKDFNRTKIIRSTKF